LFLIDRKEVVRVNLDDMIRYENEHLALDFKKKQYIDNKVELLKDLLSMANAQVEGPRYIVTGVKLLPDGSREFHPIEQVVDDAEYQELVRANIEPELRFSYQPYWIEGNLVGVYMIQVSDERKPFMMKKDYQPLKKGDSFIRRGSQQMQMTLLDFDQIYEVRHNIIKEREILRSHIHFFIKELQVTLNVLHRLKSFVGEGPPILELFDPINELCDHFIFETWDTLLSSGIISKLHFEDKDLCRYAVKTIRDVRIVLKSGTANWKRIIKWNEYELDLKRRDPGLLIQIIPPEVTLRQIVNEYNEVIKIAIEAVGNAILVLERFYEILMRATNKSHD
jgi:hypothetical protein